jgi:peptidoglycan hydrolase CwlO-like protein
MTRKNTWALLVLAAALSLPLTGCKDTKTLEDNEQLKAQVAELEKENGQAGNDLETMTAARDALTKENEKLKAEIKNLKTRSSGKRASSRKHRRSAKGHGNSKTGALAWSAQSDFCFRCQKREVGA